MVRNINSCWWTGKVVGTWTAYNNIDSHATIQPHIPDGTYAVVDTARPHPHAADPNGPYGSYGIVRFNVPGHVGVGGGIRDAPTPVIFPGRNIRPWVVSALRMPR